MNYILGTYYPKKENKNLEFKEYCLKLCPTIQFSKKQVFSYLNGNWDRQMDDFNNQNLKVYFDYYIPKYLSCFANSKIDGKLIIGIDDREEITGIPSYNLNIDKLKNNLTNSIKKYTKNGDKNINYVEIKLIQINKEKIYLDNELDLLLKEHFESLSKYKEEIKKYKVKRKAWEIQIKKYSAKLVIYLNDKILRSEFANFLRSYDDDKLIDIINLLESDQYIIYPNIEEFLERKKNKDDIMYWVVIFKDCQIEKLSRNKKPKKPRFECSHDPEKLLMKLSYLRYKLCDKLKYYVIEIDFNCSHFEKNVYFKFPNGKKWLMRKRVGTVNGPSCI